MTTPLVPRWLFDAANGYPRDIRGIAIGFAAAGYVAGWEDAITAEHKRLEAAPAAETAKPTETTPALDQLRVERDWLLAEADEDTRARFFAARAGQPATEEGHRP